MSWVQQMKRSPGENALCCVVLVVICLYVPVEQTWPRVDGAAGAHLAGGAVEARRAPGHVLYSLKM